MKSSEHCLKDESIDENACIIEVETRSTPEAAGPTSVFESLPANNVQSCPEDFNTNDEDEAQSLIKKVKVDFVIKDKSDILVYERAESFEVFDFNANPSRNSNDDYFEEVIEVDIIDQNDVEEPVKDLQIMNEELLTSQYETNYNLI